MNKPVNSGPGLVQVSRNRLFKILMAKSLEFEFLKFFNDYPHVSHKELKNFWLDYQSNYLQYEADPTFKQYFLDTAIEINTNVDDYFESFVDKGYCNHEADFFSITEQGKAKYQYYRKKNNLD